MQLTSVADRINTGPTDPNASRALVVFNLTNDPLDGVAVFRADMSWPADTPLPPVVVRDLDGVSVPSSITDRQEAVDKKGRADRRQLAFSLRFAVRDVPPQGWRTYIAAYAHAPVPNLSEVVADETPGLVVVETLRHAGELPPTASWLLLDPLPTL